MTRVITGTGAAILAAVVGWCMGGLGEAYDPLFAQQRETHESISLLASATTTTTSEAKHPAVRQLTFHAYGETTAGAGGATVVIEVSNVRPVSSTNADWITAGTISLTLGTTRTGDGFALDAPWDFVRARVTAISGTNATVSVRMGS